MDLALCFLFGEWGCPRTLRKDLAVALRSSYVVLDCASPSCLFASAAPLACAASSSPSPLLRYSPTSSLRTLRSSWPPLRPSGRPAARPWLRQLRSDCRSPPSCAVRWARNLWPRRVLPKWRSCLDDGWSTSEHGSTFLEESDSSHEFLLLGCVPHASQEVEYDAACAAQREAVSEIVDNTVGTGLLAHRHSGLFTLIILFNKIQLSPSTSHMLTDMGTQAGNDRQAPYFAVPVVG